MLSLLLLLYTSIINSILILDETLITIINLIYFSTGKKMFFI